MIKKTFLCSIRVFFGVLALAAVVAQALSLSDKGVLNLGNFLSYFTNLSNIFASIILLISAGYIIRKRTPSARDDIIRGAAVVYMVVTGVIYSTLLSKYELGLTLAWVNITLHYLMPIVVVADWLYQPAKTKLVFRQTSAWLIFPLAYLVYSLIRGHIVQWYPYPFLSPDQVGGYAGVTMYCSGILLAFFGVVWLVMQAGNRLKRHV